jgi:hypothetical protein
MTVRELRVWLSRQSPESPVEIEVWRSPTEMERACGLVVTANERDGRYITCLRVRLYEGDEP